MIQADRQIDGIRKPYVKPAIAEVALRPEEAVLGLCKLVGSGQGGPLQSICSSPAACLTTGS